MSVESYRDVKYLQIEPAPSNGTVSEPLLRHSLSSNNFFPGPAKNDHSQLSDAQISRRMLDTIAQDQELNTLYDLTRFYMRNGEAVLGVRYLTELIAKFPAASHEARLLQCRYPSQQQYQTWRTREQNEFTRWGNKHQSAKDISWYIFLVGLLDFAASFYISIYSDLSAQTQLITWMSAVFLLLLAFAVFKYGSYAFDEQSNAQRTLDWIDGCLQSGQYSDIEVVGTAVQPNQ